MSSASGDMNDELSFMHAANMTAIPIIIGTPTEGNLIGNHLYLRALPGFDNANVALSRKSKTSDINLSHSN